MHIDWAILLGTVLNSLIVLLLTKLVKLVRTGVAFLSDMSYRVNVMWAEFGREHPDLVRHHIRKTDINND